MIIEIIALENGAHRNQMGKLNHVPEGWIAVPSKLEEKAKGFLPFINLKIENGILIDVMQGIIPEPIPEQEQFSPQADTDGMLVDHEYRLTLMELGLQL